MAETLICPITCPICGKKFELRDGECFLSQVVCKCGEEFENPELEKFLKRFAIESFSADIIYHLENNELWLDTTNSANYLGFKTNDATPDNRKIGYLCRKNILECLSHQIRKKWRVKAISLYFFRRRLNKQSTGITVKQAAEILNIGVTAVLKRIKLAKSDKNYIFAEKSNPNAKSSKYIVYLK